MPVSIGVIFLNRLVSDGAVSGIGDHYFWVWMNYYSKLLMKGQVCVSVGSDK